MASEVVLRFNILIALLWVGDAGTTKQQTAQQEGTIVQDPTSNGPADQS